MEGYRLERDSVRPSIDMTREREDNETCLMKETDLTRE